MRTIRSVLSSLAFLTACLTPALAQVQAPELPRELTAVTAPPAVSLDTAASTVAFLADFDANQIETAFPVAPKELSPTHMRAKMQVTTVEKHSETSETVQFRAVSGSDPYGPNGESEDNTFARYTPSADCSLQISNPDLLGQYAVGQQVYVDFTPAD